MSQPDLPDTTTTPFPDRALDVKGMPCPHPILRTRTMLREMEAGQVVHVQATDPHSVLDFKAFCARTGHELVHVVEGPDVFEFWVRRRD